MDNIKVTDENIEKVQKSFPIMALKCLVIVSEMCYNIFSEVLRGALRRQREGYCHEKQRKKDCEAAG